MLHCHTATALASCGTPAATASDSVAVIPLMRLSSFRFCPLLSVGEPVEGGDPDEVLTLRCWSPDLPAPFGGNGPKLARSKCSATSFSRTPRLSHQEISCPLSFCASSRSRTFFRSSSVAPIFASSSVASLLPWILGIFLPLTRSHASKITSAPVDGHGGWPTSFLVCVFSPPVLLSGCFISFWPLALRPVS